MTHLFGTIEHAMSELLAGRMIILVDDENRENEGDLVMAAEHVTPQHINFMTRFGRGLICLPMSEEMIDRLALPMMTTSNRSPYGTAFTVSIEAATGVSTGISAADRARTILVAIDEKSTPDDIISPGHIFPLKARARGVLERAGQTEGSVDLMRLLGLKPAAVICEIMNDDGTMSRRDQLASFAQEHGLVMISIQSLSKFRWQLDCLVDVVATSQLPLKHGRDFTMMLFSNQIDNAEHFALIKPPRVKNAVPLVRIHSECITGDVFGSCRCDCGAQLEMALEQIGEAGGVLIYLRQEGRGIGLANKLKAYALQEQGYDTVEANEHLGLPMDNRRYDLAYQMLKYLGIDTLRLLTNNPHKMSTLMEYGLKVIERVPVSVHPTDDNRDYLKTKQDKMGHFKEI